MSIARSLTKQQYQIAALIADGLTNKEIAARLSIALATVKQHVYMTMERTGAHNRAQIAAMLARGELQIGVRQ